MKIRSPLTSLCFSPDGQLLLGAGSRNIKIYQSPSLSKSVEPLVLVRKFINIHNDDLIHCEFSPDSRFIVSTSRDLTAAVYNVH